MTVRAHVTNALAKAIRGGKETVTGGGSSEIRLTRGILKHVGSLGSCTVAIDGGTVWIPATRVGTGTVGDVVEVLVAGERIIVLGKPH